MRRIGLTTFFYAILLTAISVGCAAAQSDDVVCCRGFYGGAAFSPKDKCIADGGDIQPRSACLVGQAHKPDLEENANASGVSGAIAGVGTPIVPDVDIEDEATTGISDPRFNAAAFGNAMTRSLRRGLAGYYWRLWAGDVQVRSGAKQYARFASDGDQLSWSRKTRMHVASTSKLITAAALLHLMEEKGLDPTTTLMADYLPRYWNPSAAAKSVTIHELLTHTSGMCNGGLVYLDARRQVEKITPDAACSKGTVNYQNTNYVLLRVVMAIMSGKVDRAFADSTAPSTDADGAWNSLSLQAYKEYVWDKVFAPAGVGNIPLEDYAPTPIAYRAPPNTFIPPPGASTPGWNGFGEAEGAGAIGWQMTVDEVGKFMRALRAGKIVADVNNLFSNTYGMLPGSADCKIFGRQAYFWGGSWSDRGMPTDEIRRLTNIIAFLPDDRTLVLFTNSPFTEDSDDLGGHICELYRGAFETG